MGAARSLIVTLCLALLLLAPSRASAQEDQATTQLWAQMILGLRQTNPDWFFKFKFIPRVQVSGPENWFSSYVDAYGEYRPTRWLDLRGDLKAGYTWQSDDLQTLSVTPRVGALLHVLSDIRETGFIGQKVHRLGLATLLRLEWRNFWYSGSAAEQDYDASWRLRIRFDVRLGLNRADRSMPNTWYLFADAEAFIDLGDEIEETYHRRWRVRIGPGYRLDHNWRFELLYIFENTRNTLEGDFERSNQALDLRAAYFF